MSFIIKSLSHFVFVSQTILHVHCEQKFSVQEKLMREINSVGDAADHTDHASHKSISSHILQNFTNSRFPEEYDENDKIIVAYRDANNFTSIIRQRPTSLMSISRKESQKHKYVKVIHNDSIFDDPRKQKAVINTVIGVSVSVFLIMGACFLYFQSGDEQIEENVNSTSKTAKLLFVFMVMVEAILHTLGYVGMMIFTKDIFERFNTFQYPVFLTLSDSFGTVIILSSVYALGMIGRKDENDPNSIRDSESLLNSGNADKANDDSSKIDEENKSPGFFQNELISWNLAPLVVVNCTTGILAVWSNLYIFPHSFEMIQMAGPVLTWLMDLLLLKKKTNTSINDNVDGSKNDQSADDKANFPEIERSWLEVFSLVPILVGGVLATYVGNPHFHAVGTAMAVGVIFFRSLRYHLVAMILTPENYFEAEEAELKNENSNITPPSINVVPSPTALDRTASVQSNASVLSNVERQAFLSKTSSFTPMQKTLSVISEKRAVNFSEASNGLNQLIVGEERIRNLSKTASILSGEGGRLSKTNSVDNGNPPLSTNNLAAVAEEGTSNFTSSSKPDAWSLLFILFPFNNLFYLTFALSVDGKAPFQKVFGDNFAHRELLREMLIIKALCGAVWAVTEFKLVESIGPLATAIISNFNRVTMVIFASVYFGKALENMQIVGMVILGIGLVLKATAEYLSAAQVVEELNKE